MDDASEISFSPVKRALPLIGILSSLALGASIVRGLAQLQLLSSMGGSLTARTVVLLEVGSRRPDADAVDYPDIDLKLDAGDRTYRHRDGTKY